ncbi:GNAT family N-acetyltransferase [Kitasatospora aureofaciens]|uniref:N-acetyltransferase n=1 Tax=Kitasatospora aureofaciens TaxID=1894 RepID=A0A1E7N5F0_KITAU|nr:GNAT family N-acetyltransferase [Kitasatospora aureofaciens]QEV02377.1 GNAT family N-acetyltransferase [Streptomyces viridifaciens]ARF81133.1 N-acetyltransferase [Kitasatospora aureofaciens]OEV35921.1 GNAT family N-acetyltransferase [Kitasatospora aureofaciens]UKZ08922.1 GNAT family N-acetyltransferase [Streptomyces viridifaciens]GGU89664.1 N-acetyltransferase [Kitasatospora aureofaciens]
MGMSVIISAAAAEDAEQILKLQYLGYQPEAELYGDWAIEPLTQSLESLRTELTEQHVLVARLGDEVVGVVRGHVDAEGIGRIGRLVVHPRMQRHGLGGRLLEALERRMAEDSRPVTAYRLFTGHRSLGNLRLYARQGYRQTSVEQVSSRLSFVHLEKPVASELAATA